MTIASTPVADHGIAGVMPVLQERRHFVAFLSGCALVAAGVLLHLPMYWMGRRDGFRLAGMDVDVGMWWGMAAIVAGVACAAWGLLPLSHWNTPKVAVSAPSGSELHRAHYVLMVVLTAALMIDVMKPATLGFVLPGMRAEYALDARSVAWLPFAALCGTVLGSVIWGALADVFGRRASILLSAVIFVGTSICGAMPSYAWNVAMCSMMGAAAGGMLPVTYALLAETMPVRHRSWVLVLVGGLGSIGGYFLASLAAALLESAWSWRALWFLNLPTGLLLIALGVVIPESPQFLLRLGLREEARATLARFGSRLHEDDMSSALLWARVRDALPRRWLCTTIALSVAGIVWGLINFGMLLWLPAHMVALGYSVASVGTLLASSAFIALPTVLVAAWLYGRWSSKGGLLFSLALAAGGLGAVIHLQGGSSTIGPWVGSLALLIIGSNALLAMLLPYAAESYPAEVRGRAVGWVAACTKLGGPMAQGLAVLGMVPALGFAAILTMVATVAALFLVAVFCAETQISESP